MMPKEASMDLPAGVKANTEDHPVASLTFIDPVSPFLASVEMSATV